MVRTTEEMFCLILNRSHNSPREVRCDIEDRVDMTSLEVRSGEDVSCVYLSNSSGVDFFVTRYEDAGFRTVMVGDG